MAKRKKMSNRFNVLSATPELPVTKASPQSAKAVLAGTLTPSWFKIQPWLGVGIFVQAFVATIGSLYYSTFGDPVANVAAGNLFPANSGLEPCLLCWLARILMYPIVLISYMGIAKKDRRFTDYVLPLSGLGVLLDSYHYALQKLPIHSVFGCSLENPCSALQINYFGFITIPFLALTAFIVITVLSLLNTYIATESERIEKAKAA